MSPWLRPAILVLVLAALFFPPGPARAAAQTPGGVMGTIVDAASSRPLPDAAVTLEPRPAGAFSTGDGANGAFLRSTRTVRTDREGRYRFAPLANGEYRLHVQRLGYRPASVDVDLRDAAGSHVSVGLVVEPVALEPVRVSAAPAPIGRDAYGRLADANGTPDDRRLATERLRQRVHLPSDVRAITHADVEEGITLAETDLFRALQRLPGVSTRDDLAAELWVRGAPWEQTRVLFDGLPLFNPTQALGVFAAVNPDAVGSAFLYPGVQPASVGGGAAGALDLHSRQGGEEAMRGTGELSLVSARLALDGPTGDGRARWMISGRRTYLDWLTGMVGRATDEPDIRLPYHFADLTARVDYQLDGGQSLEASAIGSRNRITDDIPDVLQGNRVDWGNTAGRLTYVAPLRGGTLRTTVGASQSATDVRQAPLDSAREERYGAARLPAFRVGVRQLALGGDWEAAGRTAWSGGYELTSTAVSGEVRGLTSFDGDTIAGLVSGGDRLLQLAGWAARRWEPAPKFSVDAGLRVEAGEPVRNGGTVRLAPRFSARYRPDGALSLSAGLGRTWQYVQSPLGGGRSVASDLLNGHFWLVAGDSFPALRADIFTVGAERWLGSEWLVAANAYLRRASGVVIPDPTPGELPERPLYVEADDDARGLELSARKLAGRWTASLAYTLAASELDAEGLRFAAPTDRRHTLDATAALRLGRAWRLGAAFTAASGEPYTRYWEPAGCYSPETECAEAHEERIGEPAAERNVGYRSLDLLGEWNHRFRGWQFGAFLQLRNALGHRNQGAYYRSYDPLCMTRIDGECRTYMQQSDEFLPGIPTVPVFGFRLAF